MVARDGGVDLACTWGGETHGLRLRFCLDAHRRVRLLGTGVVYGKLTTVEVCTQGRRLTMRVQPAQHKHLVSKCMACARPKLTEALGAYLGRFSPRLLSVLNLTRVAGLQS